MRMKKKSRFVPWKLGLAVCALTLILGTGGVSISAAQSAALTPELETTIVPKPTITPKPTVTPKPTPKPVKKGLVKEGRVYRYYVKTKRDRQAPWKTVKMGKAVNWFKYPIQLLLMTAHIKSEAYFMFSMKRPRGLSLVKQPL